MLVSALAISAPAFAQDATNASETAQPAKENAKQSSKKGKRTPAPLGTATPTVAAEDAPIAGAPVTDTTPAPAEQAAAPAPATQPATAPAETAAAAPTPAAPAATSEPAAPAAAVTGASQIAQVVNTEFPTYDKNADTNLDRNEFAAWMVALKTASDPATKASDPATVKWVDGAFASADADKSKAVSKDELTKYLSQGAG
ncbi:EF-hand domain-containing protein [Sphingomonas donggukensis]|uniref:EF-hand domain-containing protein n=1 Tax=Sphingomonas donggukensis TaxID=2949093 RepID=A0ABY4TR94_9SPHN|nr:EF-hand domain-containing protein [Sphingomonas donggukensis]URW74918.1 EF-hand domain-containing protein [Sphingomonas donggukensis]